MSEEDDSMEPAVAAWLAVGEGWPEKMERPRGILSDVDRQFIWGVKDYNTAPQRSNRRGTIRERVENGLLDLGYLPMIDEDQRDKILNELTNEEGEGELYDSISSLIQFLFLGFDGDKGELAHMIENGIYNAESDPGVGRRHRGGVKDVTVDINIDYDYDAEAIYERFENGEAHRLTPAEIGILVREEMLEADDLDKLGYWMGLERKDGD